MKHAKDLKNDAHGWVYHSGKFRPFFNWRDDIANTGRVVVTIRDGGKSKDVLVNKDKISKYPKNN